MEQVQNLNQENIQFYKDTESSFRELFESAKNMHELHFALALTLEMRGIQDEGWNTAIESIQVFNEYLEFINELEFGRMRARVSLAFYCHLAESSGFYEIPKKMLCICEGKENGVWPFNEIVSEHKISGDRIAPNANRVIKNLIGHSDTLGFNMLAKVFKGAFNPDIRNGYAHADYIVWKDGLRLPKRNGGNAITIPWKEYDLLFERGIKFFNIIREVIYEHVKSYENPTRVKASIHTEPESIWTISYNPKTNSLEISK